MAITEKYANFDLATGANDGSSEANAWQVPADIVYAAGERVNIKATASRFALTASHTSAVAGSTTQPVYVRGYTSTIGDGGSFLFSTSSTYQWAYTGDNVIVENIDLTSTGTISTIPFNFASDGGLVRNLKAVKTTTGAYSQPVVQIQDASCDNIYVEGNGNSSSTMEALYLFRGAGIGVEVKTTAGMGGIRTSHGYRASSLSRVLVYSTVSTTKMGIYVFDLINNQIFHLDSFTIDGFDEGLLFEEMPTDASAPAVVTNGIISGSVNAITTDAVTERTGVAFGTIASYNNTNDYSDMDDNVVINPIALTADPYVDSANGDFRPNNTAGGGALLRGLAGMGAGMTTNNLDIGALQHADPAGGGGGMIIHPGMTGGMNG